VDGQNGPSVRFLTRKIDTLSERAEFERSMICQRIQEGIRRGASHVAAFQPVG
jgi:DNA invertase Pin-like site-specific DNA recombinase